VIVMPSRLVFISFVLGFALRYASTVETNQHLLVIVGQQMVVSLTTSCREVLSFLTESRCGFVACINTLFDS
jgi:hypothetical protein